AGKSIKQCVRDKAITVFSPPDAPNWCILVQPCQHPSERENNQPQGTSAEASLCLQELRNRSRPWPGSTISAITVFWWNSSSRESRPVSKRKRHSSSWPSAFDQPVIPSR